MENHHLKDRLDAMNSSTHITSQVVEKKERSQSVINLENIYNQGFHICNLYYGKRRESDENCMFCTEILFGEH